VLLPHNGRGTIAISRSTASKDRVLTWVSDTNILVSRTHLCKTQQSWGRFFEGDELDSPGILKCPNCGGARFSGSDQGSQSCEYCGTVIETTGSASEFVRCPRCRFENDKGARYCRECGLALDKWQPARTNRPDLAVISIAATVIGSMFVPVGGALLGLFLAYKARDRARATNQMGGNAELARIAILVGWAGLGITLVPLCLFPLLMSGPIAVSMCSGMHPLSLLAFGL
jgi:uncharacterized protein (DUF983 family)